MNSPITRVLAFALALSAMTGSFAAGVVSVALLPTQNPSYRNPLALQNVSVSAKAALLLDVKTGRVLYQKNANQELPLASLTKLMAAQVALAAHDGDTVVQITNDALKPEGDSGLRIGDAFPLNDLVRLALVASSNDAAAAAATAFGDDYLLAMNSVAQDLGLTKTRFLNPTGLDLNEENAGAYGSAYDMARMTAAFFKDHPDLFEATMHADVSVPQGEGNLVAAATAAPLLDMPGLIGGKTGFTDLAGGNLVVAFDLEVGRPVVAVVLGSTREGRFSDIRALITAARNNL